MKTKLRPNRAKESLRALQYIALLFSFFSMMMLSFSYLGEVAFGFFIGIPPLFAFLAGKRKTYLFIVYFVCVCFAVGQRTVHWGHARFVPSEVLLWTLGLLCFKLRPRNSSIRYPLPFVVYTLFIASFVVLIISLLSASDITIPVCWAKMVLLPLPTFMVCRTFLDSFEQIETFSMLLCVECLYLSLLALSEYFNLPIVGLFGGYLQNLSSETVEGFNRLGACFWGGYMLAGFLLVCFPIGLALFFSAKTLTIRIIAASSLFFSLIEIYLSGYRSLWLIGFLTISLFFLLRGARSIFLLCFLFGIGLHFVPESGKERAQTVYGEKRDSSSKERENRAAEAWALIKANPILGNGWGASGLVHSDWLQLWADAGIIPFSSFILLFLNVIRRLYLTIRRTRDEKFKNYIYGFLTSALCMLLIFSVQAIFSLPENYTPMWFILGIAFMFPAIIRIEMNSRLESNAVSK